MIKFFRKIRQKMLAENKFSKYLIYAIGEIVLVVIGILIALSLNNWNENRKERIKEQAVLTEISNSIDSDLIFFKKYLDYRLGQKAEGISGLLKMIGEKEKPFSNDSLMQLFGKAETDIIINYDSGPYDAIKTHGLNIITNDSLRKLIINNYEVLFPAFKEFGSNVPELVNPIIENLKIELFKKEAVQKENGDWVIIDVPKHNEILENPDLTYIIGLEDRKYHNYTTRLKGVRKNMIKLNKYIYKELDIMKTK